MTAAPTRPIKSGVKCGFDFDHMGLAALMHPDGADPIAEFELARIDCRITGLDLAHRVAHGVPDFGAQNLARRVPENL